MDKPHLFLNNPRGEKNRFNAGRNIDPTDDTDVKPPESYTEQKQKLLKCLANFNTSLDKRIQERKLKVPAHINYIKIDFFIVFNDAEPYKTKSKFLNDFGLTPVSYSNFNQTVLFAIIDFKKFKKFEDFVVNFFDSRNNISPQGKPYSIITLIFNFDFLGTMQMLNNAPKKDILISLVRKDEGISEEFNKIFTSLISHVRALSKENTEIKFNSDGVTTIEIQNISKDKIKAIAENFDIVYRIQSLRSVKIRPSRINIPELTWDFTIKRPQNQRTMIGIIDNGVRPINLIKDIIINFNLDITNKNKPNPLSASHPHGTVVATLAAVGLEYFNTENVNIQADAFIVPIKILNDERGTFNIYDIRNALQTAINKGIRIFNLSVCGPTKMYNSTVSEYAYMLDQLAFENDILIFIATGNLNYDDIEAMQADVGLGNNHDFHIYPKHFYNPFKNSDYHNCEASNICLPGESFNNITVGAIAENMNPDSQTSLTPFKELPAYYTLKSHIDYSKKVNETWFSPKQQNFKINKPDIVMPGGDLINPESRMRVIDFGENGYFFQEDAGTSYASPLAANIAAKVINLYPALNMQSVKALILNNASKLLSSEFLNPLINEIKNEASREHFHKSFSRLSSKEKKIINSQFKSELLYQRLAGYGMPELQKTLYSNNKSVTTIIQDSIKIGFHKVVNINIPQYLLEYDRPSYILTLKATLCYKFLPTWENQLGYNPVHMSFNFANSVAEDDPIKMADIISNPKHDFFSELTPDEASDKEKVDARKKALGIKASLTSWSEDFFPPASKPFSNTQQVTIHINRDEISKVNNQISTIIRCTHKRDLDKETHDNLIKSLHQFSIVISITERENSALSAYSLYNELVNINDLDVISVLESDAEGDLDL